MAKSDELEQLMADTDFPDRLKPIARAFYSQESSSGKADTSKENSSGAIGPMQMTRKTFDGMKKNGTLPADLDFNNPRDTTLAALAHIADLDKQYGGSVRKVAAVYYGGPKSVGAGGDIKVFNDMKNPNAPNTQQYADSIERKVGGQAMRTSARPQRVDNSEAFRAELQGSLKQNDNSEAFRQDLSSSLNKGGGTEQPTGATQAQENPTGERTLLQKGGRIASEVIGGVGGGMLGGSLGGLVAGAGAAPGALIGGAAGAAAGSKFANTFDPLPPEDQTREMVLAAAGNLIPGAIGKVIGGVIGKKTISEGGQALLKTLEGKGITPIPSQVFEGEGLQRLENIGSAALFGPNVIRNAKETVIKGAQVSLNDWKNKWAMAGQQADRMYAEVAAGTAAKSVQVPIQEARQAAETVVKAFPADSAVSRAANKILKQQGDEMPFDMPIEKAISLDQAARAQASATGIAPGVQYSGAMSVRADLMKIVENAATDSNEKKAAQSILTRLDSSMGQSLAKADKDLYGKFRSGDFYYKAGQQGETINKILTDSLVPSGEIGQVGGKQLANHVQDLSKTNLTDVQKDTLNQFARALKAAEGGGSHALEFVVRGAQINSVIQIGGAAAAGLSLATGQDKKLTGTAMAVALGPVALAKIFTSPKTFRMMIRAMNAPAGTEAGIQAGAQFVTQAVHEGIITSPDERPNEKTQ